MSLIGNPALWVLGYLAGLTMVLGSYTSSAMYMASALLLAGIYLKDAPASRSETTAPDAVCDDSD